VEEGARELNRNTVKNTYSRIFLLSLASSFRQKAHIDISFFALTGVPLGLTGTRVPAASAFLCSLWTRSFLLIGIVGASCCSRKFCFWDV
jgi:hypothetical protein